MQDIIHEIMFTHFLTHYLDREAYSAIVD